MRKIYGNRIVGLYLAQREKAWILKRLAMLKSFYQSEIVNAGLSGLNKIC